MYTVERISILSLVFYFVGYLILHILIALYSRSIRLEIENGNKTKEIKNKFKWINRLDKWFPALYVIYLLIVFAV